MHTLTPFEHWMVRSNLATIESGADPAALIALLRANGYPKVAAGVEQTLSNKQMNPHTDTAAGWLAQLSEWLATHGCHEIQPVTVTIQNETWIACRYKRTLQYQPGMMAVTLGKKRAGDTYVIESIYVIGTLPKCYKRRKGICFPFEGLDWYISGYMTGEHVTDANKYYHPFGANFMLAPWDHPGSHIDDGEPTPYKRIEIHITPFGT